MSDLSAIQRRTFRLNILQLSPRSLDTIKLVAFLAMLLDHFNTLFLSPARPEMYAIGRMAFPLFCLVWAINIQRTPEKLPLRAKRLWKWAIITQPIFYLAFNKHDPWYAAHILFVFAVGTQLLAWMHLHGKKGLLRCGLLILASLPWLAPASYGLQGLVLALSLAIWLSPVFNEKNIIPETLISAALLTLNGVAHIGTQPANTLLYAVLPTVILPLATISVAQKVSLKNDKRFMPRNFFYVSYFGHLLLFGVLTATF